jgi:hypothetical protein
MKRLLIIAGLLIVLMVILGSFIPAAAEANTYVPRIKVKQGTSSNWSGYVAETNLNSPQKGSVTYVAGTWKVPSVTGTDANAYSSIWVGIDGNDSNTVEQIGTDQYWINGSPVYDAWFEMYPKWPYTINTVDIHPGDTISASVSYASRGIFTLTLANLTTGKTFTINQKSASAFRNSAEWIVEAPWSAGVLPLADFGSATFTNCSATLTGTNGPISRWAYDAIDMVNSSEALKAQTGPLNRKGNGFTVNWISSN